ncbi:hypothetical protein ACJMK2_020961 [Sinanodonta woodiana]|uniref:small monomeric GTPase n=1 Tax=Sinanodonta woodiana TaxID=1069815 RepID=A0ABD3U0N6_SINWO
MKGGPFHILVLGKEGVGKTAVVVRYLTGRYLSEYAHADENVYERTVNVDGKSVSIKITDVGGKNIERKASNKDLLFKVDGVVIVYSVTDRHSFDVAEAIVDWMKKDQKNSFPIPIVLLGNKCDLDHSRVVAKQNAGDEDELEWRNSGYMISDCSACSGSDTTIVKVFKKLIQKIQERREMVSRTPKKLSTNPLSSPRLLRATLRRFSVFNRERTSSM